MDIYAAVRVNAIARRKTTFVQLVEGKAIYASSEKQNYRTPQVLVEFVTQWTQLALNWDAKIPGTDETDPGFRVSGGKVPLSAYFASLSICAPDKTNAFLSIERSGCKRWKFNSQGTRRLGVKSAIASAPYSPYSSPGERGIIEGRRVSTVAAEGDDARLTAVGGASDGGYRAVALGTTARGQNESNQLLEHLFFVGVTRFLFILGQGEKVGSGRCALVNSSQ